jgi:lipoate-protein ligase B
MTAGVNSYYLARSVLAGRDIPVLHIQTDTDIPFHMVEQLLTYALVDVASKDRVLRMEGWITTHEQHLESLVDGLSTRKKQAALMGLTDSRVRAIRDDTNKKKKMPTAQMQLI